MPISTTTTAELRTLRLQDTGEVPNNPGLPVLIYAGVVPADEGESFCRSRLAEHGWGGVWINGVYDFHHFHSTNHEFLAVLCGSARLQLGGPEGEEVEVSAGDALVLPAGTGHCNLGHSFDFRVLGAYPGDHQHDMCRRADGEGEGEAVRERIAAVQVPSADPLFGQEGPLVKCWTPGP